MGGWGVRGVLDRGSIGTDQVGPDEGDDRLFPDNNPGV